MSRLSVRVHMPKSLCEISSFVTAFFVLCKVVRSSFERVVIVQMKSIEH